VSEKTALSLDVPWPPEDGGPDSAYCTRTAAVEVFAKFRRLTITSTRRHFHSMSRRTGINGAMTAALWEIKRSPGLRICDLSGAMAIHQSTASNLVDKLMKRALVRRNASDSDRRVVRFYLTAEGEELVKRAPQPSRILLQDALTRLTPDALKTLNELLDFLIRELDGSSGESAGRLAEVRFQDAA
jgi:DNA-binding MarR family transcriptional regulator